MARLGVMVGLVFLGIALGIPEKALGEASRSCDLAIERELQVVPRHSRRFTERVLTTVIEEEMREGAARVYIRQQIRNRATTFRVRLSEDNVEGMVDRAIGAVRRLRRGAC